MPTLALPSARPHAWYSNSTDGSLDYDNNPFAKKRRPSVYPEPEVAEEPKPPDSENFVAELVRRGTKKLTFTKPQQARTTIRTNIETTLSPLHPADEENAAPKEDSHEGGHSEGQKSKSMTWVQSISLFQRRLRRQLAKLGLGSRWEVKYAIADIATSTIAFAPLSVSGQYFLPATPRPCQTVVVDFDADESKASDYVSHTQKPLFRRFPSKTKHQHNDLGRFTGLCALTREVHELNSILDHNLTALIRADER
ncbi:MAG: hypothetical protein Q9198_006880 [Flavoplaca austrocitrina]